ncbi:MAG TPA: hypothetical protein PKC58_17475 [Ignavibacteria bacterium]|nr:hypothetical protein [Ignavibacteria bacterium]
MKIVYVLGAGYSYNANFPLQAEILSRIYQLDKNITGDAIDFLTSIYGKKDLPALEDVYTLLDSAVSRRENFHGLDFNDLDNIRDNLTRSILYIMHSSSANFFNNYSGKFPPIISDRKSNLITNKVRSFYNANAEHFIRERISNGRKSDAFSIISLNWDTLLEDSIYECKKHLNGKYNVDIDYCCYTNPLKDSPHTNSLVQRSRDIYNIKILKLHSSVNWLLCPNCNRLFTGLGSKEDIWTLYMETIKCPKCSWESDFIASKKTPTLMPFLISPTFLKNVDSNTHINMIWHNAFVELSEADKIVIIGYSLPEADYKIRTLLKRSIKKNSYIEIILKRKDNFTKNSDESLRKFYPSERYKCFFPKSLYQVKFNFSGIENYFGKIHKMINGKNYFKKRNLN